MKIISGHISYVDLETTCPRCQRVVRCHIPPTSLKDFPKRLKFSCKQLACSKEWWKIVSIEASAIEYETYKSFWKKLSVFFLGK